MADQRAGGIAWTDETWNPIRGCSRMSEGCRFCYAEGIAARFSGEGQPFEGLIRDGKWNGAVKLVKEKLLSPLRWRRPRRVFVTSVSDPFHPAVTDDMLDRLFAVMALAPQHTFQLLTKRPERMREYLDGIENGRTRAGRLGRAFDPQADISGTGPNHNMIVEGARMWPFPNVWLGVSVENQAAADQRIPHLLKTPAAVRFLSCEPLLGPVDLTAIRWRDGDDDVYFDAMAGGHSMLDSLGKDMSVDGPTWPTLDWVIAGGESGPKARPMHPDWARDLRDQCAAAGVSFFFKQWGEWASAKGLPGHIPIGHVFDDGYQMIRVGKKAAGRLLDSLEHNAFPVIRHGEA